MTPEKNQSNDKIVTNIYNQIDYTVLDQKQKQTLTAARSYRGTETSSDHRLVVTRMEITWPKLYQLRIPRSHQHMFDKKHLTQSKVIKTVTTIN